MRFLKTVLFTLMAGVYYIVGRISEYVWHHRLPFGIFGGLLAIMCIVYAIAPENAREHIVDREVLHNGWGALLFMLLSRLILVWERVRDKAIAWYVWYFGPLVLMLAINATNEWVFSFTQILPGENFVDPFGGDWARAKRAGDLALRWKSFADLAGWQFGGLVAAWWSYYMADQLSWARRHYLDALEWRRTKRHT